MVVLVVVVMVVVIVMVVVVVASSNGCWIICQDAPMWPFFNRALHFALHLLPPSLRASQDKVAQSFDKILGTCSTAVKPP